MTEIKSSLIPQAGRGVFTVREFKKGEKVSFYDGYYKDQKLSEFEQGYSITDENRFFVGYFQPKTSSGNAQIINDGYSPHLTKKQISRLNSGSLKDRFIYGSELVINYLQTSLKLENVNPFGSSHRDKEYWFYATRDIQVGEELYFSYSQRYWFQLYDRNVGGIFSQLSQLEEQVTSNISDEKLQKSLKILQNKGLSTGPRAHLIGYQTIVDGLRKGKLVPIEKDGIIMVKTV